jgi:hypothetical protein
MVLSNLVRLPRGSLDGWSPGGGDKEDEDDCWSPLARERRHTLGVSQLTGRRPQMSSLLDGLADDRPPPVAGAAGSGTVVVRTLSTAGQESAP